DEGLSVKDAIVSASPTRLRPILMTTVSTIAGAIPAAMSLDLSWAGLGASGGMELRAPMAIAVIGGLTLSTLLTLFVVPAVYAMFEDIKDLFGIGRKPVPASGVALPEISSPAAASPSGPAPVSPSSASPVEPFENRT